MLFSCQLIKIETRRFPFYSHTRPIVVQTFNQQLHAFKEQATHVVGKKLEHVPPSEEHGQSSSLYKDSWHSTTPFIRTVKDDIRQSNSRNSEED